MINQNFLTPQFAALSTGAARGDRPVRPPSLRHWTSSSSSSFPVISRVTSTTVHFLCVRYVYTTLLKPTSVLAFALHISCSFSIRIPNISTVRQHSAQFVIQGTVLATIGMFVCLSITLALVLSKRRKLKSRNLHLRIAPCTSPL